jgi:dCMP deaminase
MKWDLRFLGLAKHISEWSLDPSTKVGAVIVDDKNRVISLGFNGFPRGIKDDDRLLDRNKKLAIILHAEKNAIIFANKNLENSVIYTYPFPPCSVCAASIIQSGITRVVSVISYNTRWADSFKLSEEMFAEAGVELCLYKPEELRASTDYENQV